MGEPEKARDAYRQAVALNPGYAAAYLNLALLMRRSRTSPEEARQYFQKTCQLQRDAVPPVRGAIPAAIGLFSHEDVAPVPSK